MNLKIEDLRVGNYIDYECTTHIITGLHKNGKIYSNWINALEEEPYIDHITNHRGIELNEETFAQLGFSEEFSEADGIGVFSWFENDDIILTNCGKGFYSIEGMRCKPFKYVHQLQNLYYDVTGKFLNFKNKKRLRIIPNIPQEQRERLNEGVPQKPTPPPERIIREGRETVERPYPHKIDPSKVIKTSPIMIKEGKEFPQKPKPPREIRNNIFTDFINF